MNPLKDLRNFSCVCILAHLVKYGITNQFHNRPTVCYAMLRYKPSLLSKEVGERIIKEQAGGGNPVAGDSQKKDLLLAKELPQVEITHQDDDGSKVEEMVSTPMNANATTGDLHSFWLLQERCEYGLFLPVP